MSELTFARTFLTALDARPQKLSSDHIADPRSYPPQPAFVLPKLSTPPHPARPNAAPPTSTPASSSSLTITLKPMKPSSPTLPLNDINAATTSIFDLKERYSAASSVPTGRIKILYKKKPAVDSKTVAEVIGSEAGASVEFSVMLMGGAVFGGSAAVPSPPAAAPSEAFWEDLKGFVLQRIRDEKEGERLVELFKGAWEKDK
ncbi:hypothetical protein EJ04DRAFT_42513 [Polyplosphaeria fusca]|uniref:Ubiquitin-like domain-containing protein n=1 Tax=Polyplosphaeria fusca TaxID=682080 RepID=A0A9P4V3M2_9PLEO|nr:hypothetical protein EJ04DRAFT_42513 [Polyplosphaeria fusca]